MNEQDLANTISGYCDHLAATGSSLLQHPHFHSYLNDFTQYMRSPGHEERISLQPCVNDKKDTTPLNHYNFYQNTWAAGKIFQIRPERVVDMGSDALFVGIISQFVPTLRLGSRPLIVTIPGLNCKHASVTSLPFEDGSVGFLSSMGVIGHIGLGRYGDGLDTQGSLKAIREMVRIVEPGGHILFSIPLSHTPGLSFNAHRIFSKEQVLSHLQGLQLQEEIFLFPEPGPEEDMGRLQDFQYCIWCAHMIKKIEQKPLAMNDSRAQARGSVESGLIGNAGWEKEQNSAEAYVRSARLEYNQNHFEQAEKMMREAAILSPDDASISNSLGVIQYRQGKLEEARASFENTLALDVSCKDADTNLRRIRIELINNRIEQALSEKSLGKYKHLMTDISIFIKHYQEDDSAACPVITRLREQLQAKRAQDNKKEVVFLSVFPRVDMAKKADALSKTGKYRVKMMCLGRAATGLNNFFRQFFDEIIPFNNRIDLVNLLLSLTPDVIISRPRDQIAAFAIIFGNAPVIFNVYDIVSVGSHSELAIEAEKFCFENAEGIIHKGRKEEIDKYVRPLCDVNGKVLHFYPYCWERSFPAENLPKLSEKDGVPHIVYTGIVTPSHEDKNTMGHSQFAPMIEAVTRQNIHWHIYYNPEVGINDQYYKEYFDLAEKNPFFHFHTPLANDQLCQKITQYDFGYMVHDVRGTIYTDIVHDISMANKIFTYLEAGLPMIVGDSFRAVADFVEEHSVGIVVDSTDLTDLYDRIRNTDYEALRKNALKARSELSLNNNIHKLDELIESLRK